MPEFLNYVLYLFRSSLTLVLIAGALALLMLVIAHRIHKKKYGGEKPFPWLSSLLYLMLAGYLFIVLYATLLRYPGGRSEYNLHLFRAWLDAWNHYSVKSFANLLLNIAMFAPLGFLLPLLSKKLRNWHRVTGIGFAFSLAIETVQLITGRGVWDIDDLFCNTLGAVIGFLLVMAVVSLSSRQTRKTGLLYAAGALASILSICGVFLVYNTREYGNLPSAPSYTVHTADVQWQLDCSLPQAQDTAPIYQNQPRSKQDCDIFADDFKTILQTEYNTISYYEEAAYYMDNGSDGGAHFLYVNYSDQGYTYQGSFEETDWMDADRNTVEKALEPYPVQIPEAAVFQPEEEGWYCISAEQLLDGTTMYDGQLRVRCSGDGTVWDIENSLLCFTFHDTVKIITPDEAYRRLCAGKFNDGGLFEHMKPKEVAVHSCSLGYAIDTKGFYQPVYYFTVASPDASYSYRIMIPAMT